MRDIQRMPFFFIHQYRVPKMNENWIAPSILSADFARLGEEVQNVLKAGADIVHFDVMDNHYVPNLTIGPLVCEALRKHGVTAPIDVHLMVKPVDRIIPDFAKAGASIITFHPEASEHIDRSLQLVKDNGCQCGLVFNPATPLSYLDYVMDKVDMILLMSVNPGFGGQSFIPYVLDKAREVAARIKASGRNIRLEIDGGVGPKNIREVREAGVDTFVAGSAVFGQAKATDPNRYDTIIKALRDELAAAKV
jgi:ribulose-phosphate 3-epimerase